MQFPVQGSPVNTCCFCIAKLLKEDQIWTKKHLKLGGHSCAEREVSSLEKKLLLDNTIQDSYYRPLAYSTVQK